MRLFRTKAETVVALLGAARIANSGLFLQPTRRYVQRFPPPGQTPLRPAAAAAQEASDEPEVIAAMEE